MKFYKHALVITGIMTLGTATYIQAATETATGPRAASNASVDVKDDSQKECDRHFRHRRDMSEEREDGDHGSRYSRNHFAKELELTETQQKTLKDAREKQAPAQRELHEKIRAARDALDKAGEANASDAELNKLASNLSTLMAQAEVSRIKAHQQLNSVLTAEQKQKLSQLKLLDSVPISFITMEKPLTKLFRFLANG